MRTIVEVWGMPMLVVVLAGCFGDIELPPLPADGEVGDAARDSRVGDGGEGDVGQGGSGGPPDMRVVEADMRMVEPDMRMVVPDMRTVEADMRVEPDMRIEEPDMRIVEPDMRMVEPDMRIEEPDMRVEPDLGMACMTNDNCRLAERCEDGFCAPCDDCEVGEERECTGCGTPGTQRCGAHCRWQLCEFQSPEIVWRQVSEIPEDLGGATRRLDGAAVLGDEIHIISGPIARHGAFNVVTGAWTVFNSAGRDLNDGNLEAIDDTLYAFGEANVAVWSQADDSWAPLQMRPQPINQARSVAVNNEVFMLGSDRRADSRAFAKYEVENDRWVNLPDARSDAVGAAVAHFENRIYGFGGSREERTTRIFDLNDGAWLPDSDSGDAISEGAAAIVDRDVIFVVSDGLVHFYRPNYEHPSGNPVLDHLKWCEARNAPFSLRWHRAVKHGDAIYVFGGENGELNGSAAVWRGVIRYQ